MRPIPKMPMGGPRGPVMPGKPMPGPAVNVLPSKPTMPGMGSGPMPPNPVSRPPTMPGPAVNRPMAMKKGGSASSRADGCAMRGKTKGKMITMAGGGKAC